MRLGCKYAAALRLFALLAYNDGIIGIINFNFIAILEIMFI